MANTINHKRRELHYRWTSTPSISAVHRRLVKRYGIAKNFSCVDCGRKAQDWSWMNKGSKHVESNYKPRCHSCNIKSDYTELWREKTRKSMMGKRNGLGYRFTKAQRLHFSKMLRGNKRRLGIKHSEEFKKGSSKRAIKRKRDKYGKFKKK